VPKRFRSCIGSPHRRQQLAITMGRHVARDRQCHRRNAERPLPSSGYRRLALTHRDAPCLRVSPPAVLLPQRLWPGMRRGAGNAVVLATAPASLGSPVAGERAATSGTIGLNGLLQQSGECALVGIAEFDHGSHSPARLNPRPSPPRGRPGKRLLPAGPGEPPLRGRSPARSSARPL
jgi:hypothetical protein